MSDTPPNPPTETVSATSIYANPVLAACGVLLGAVGGYLVKQGLITGSELAIVAPALVTVGAAAWRAWVSHHNADKALRIASNPANTAVTVK